MEKKCSLVFLLGIILLEFTNVFALSGYAETINYTVLCTYLSVGAFFIRVLQEKRIKPITGIGTFILMSCGIALIIFNVLVNWKDSLQITNFLTLFGIIAWVGAFSKIQWNEQRFYYVGIVSCIMSISLIYLFLPGNILSGWNSNSAISVLPILLFGLSCIWCCNARNKYFWIWGIVVVTTPLLLSLENRSSFLSLVIYMIMLLVGSSYKKRVLFRAIYCCIIIINVGLPFFYQKVMQLEIFQTISEVMILFFGKGTLLNGREELWNTATLQISQNKLLGTAGVRTAYYHNFSLDVLTQFGWVGWLVFIVLLIVILEKGFKIASQYNIFFIAFICILFLNTFENVLVCNNLFMVFAYMLLAVPWSLNFNKQIK